MRNLCYIPIPTEFENSKSIWMRMAHYNGFGNVRALCAFFGIVPRSWVEVLYTNSPLLDVIDREAPQLTEIIRQACYSKESGQVNFKLAGVYFPAGSCSMT